MWLPMFTSGSLLSLHIWYSIRCGTFATCIIYTLSKAYHSPPPPHLSLSLSLSSLSKENCIDGVEFLLLKDEEVKEMVPPLGIAKKIIRLIPRSEVNNTIQAYNSYECVFILVSIV